MKKYILAATALALIAPAAAQAQYTGPTAIPAGTIADIEENAKDDDSVRLTGKILRKTGDETYVFADDTGEINVEIDDKLFTSPVTENTIVEIHGEVDKHVFKATDIDVETLIIKQ